MAPLIPNYKPGIGRLVTDRGDFQDHVDGYNFRHKANQIDLLSTLVIGNQSTSNVQDAISALSVIAFPPIINDATTSSKGIIQLTGDIAGISTNIVVTKIQGKPIASLAPNNGDVLTWNSFSGSWGPSSASGAFSANGDLSGTSSLQHVISLTGNAGNVNVLCNNIAFSFNTTPLITQNSSPTLDGASLNIKAQSALNTNKNGGLITIAGGTPGSGGLRGGVSLQVDTANMLQLTEVASNRRVLSLLDANPLTTGDMPAGTGDMVIYVKDTATPPTSGNPVGGTIVYSLGGQLYVKQQDGNNFSIGSVPNPSIWGPTGQQVYSSRAYVTTNSASPIVAFSFVLPDLTATKVDVIFVGKGVGNSNSGQFNLSMGYVRNASGPSPVGSLTNADPRVTAGAVGWTIPNITVSGNTLQVFTGASGSMNINWVVVVQLTMSQG